MNHVRYMAAQVCSHLATYLRRPLDEVGIDYLAMHIERVASREE
jgi:hypothetical protein